MIPPAEDMPSAKSESRYYDDTYELREMRILRKNVEFAIGNLDAHMTKISYPYTNGEKPDDLPELDREHRDMRDALRKILTDLNRWHGAERRGW